MDLHIQHQINHSCFRQTERQTIVVTLCLHFAATVTEVNCKVDNAAM